MKKAMVMAVAVVACGVFFIGGCAKKEVLRGEAEFKEKQAAVTAESSVKEKTSGQKAAQKAGAETTGTADVKEKQARAEKASAGATGKEAKKDKVGKEEEITLTNIHFDLDKFSLRPEVRETLKQHAELLAKNKNYHITIEGHCDERGTAEYNLALGERRADAAKKYLVQLGVDEARIKTISFGFEKPLNPGHDEEAWAKNRRDSFVTMTRR